MLALLFLLLPIAAAYGWYMGGRSSRQNRQKRSGKLSKEYVTGLNFLLSDQPDKAVDLFINLLEVDDDTIDTHLALGNLFRQRGEVDRAIRIHQNLIARPSLSTDQRLLALLQLAKDYMAAGLVDRAETIYIQLLDDPEYESAALKQLQTIYQQLKDWKQAISISKRLIKFGNKKVPCQLAHYYCEQASLELKQGNAKKAENLYKKALSTDKNCVRANIAMAELLISNEKVKSAISHLCGVLEQDPQLVSETLPLLNVCFSSREEKQDLADYLRKALITGAGISVAISLAELIAEQVSDDAGRALIQGELIRHPSLKGFHALMGYHLKEAEAGSARKSLSMLQDMVAEQIQLRPSYRCCKCGYSGHFHHWLCSSCKNWGVVKPVIGLDGE